MVRPAGGPDRDMAPNEVALSVIGQDLARLDQFFRKPIKA
jgi:hypothetical protein